MPDDKQDVRTEQHGDKLFKLEQAMEYIIDDYDEYLGSVELSHYEALNYYNVTDYKPLDATTMDTLDLTWVSSNDVIDLSYLSFQEEEKQYLAYVSKIIVNIDALTYGRIKGMHNFTLEVHNSDVKLSVINQVKTLKKFLENTKDISAVKFVGYSPIMEAILSQVAKSCEIEVKKENDEYKKY